MPAIPVDDGAFPNPYATPQVNIPEGGIGLSDYARAVGSGAYGVVSGLAGAASYAGRSLEVGDSVPEDVRKWADDNAKAQVEAMSPRARTALQAPILPGDDGKSVWDSDVSTSGALGLKTASSIPSLLASIIPGGLAARAALAAGAGVGTASAVGTNLGGAVAGAMTGGDLFNDIKKNIVDERDDKLQEQSSVYKGLRSMGLSEADAKSQLVDAAEGYKPLYMAAVTMLTSRFGVESLVSRRAAGAAGGGRVRTGLHGLLGEATQEATENAAQELMTQQGRMDVTDARGKGNYDWYKVLSQAVEGGTIGGLLGGATGLASGRSHGRAIPTDLPETSRPGVSVGEYGPDQLATVKPSPTTVATPVPQELPSTTPEAVRPGGPETATPGATAPVPGQAAVDELAAHPAGTPVTQEVNAQPTTVAAVAKPTLPFSDIGGENPDAVVDTTSTPPRNVVVTPQVNEAITNPVPVVSDVPATPGTTQPIVPAEAFERAKAKREQRQKEKSKVLKSAEEIERVESPALKVGDEIVKGHTHIDALDRAAKQLGITAEEVAERVGTGDNNYIAEDGFVTSEGRFVSRAEAADIDARYQASKKPKVLKSAKDIQAETKARQLKGDRFTNAEALKVLRGEREVTSLSTDPEHIGGESDRNTIRRYIKRLSEVAEKEGLSLPPVWAEMQKLQGLGWGAQKQRWMELRQQLQERQTAEVAKRIDTGKKRTSAAEELRVEERKAAQEAEATKARTLLDEVKPAEGLVERDDLAGMQAHIDNLVSQAKDQGISLTSKGDAPDELLHLANAAALAGKKTNRLQASGKQRLRDFMVSEMALRSGEKGVVREYRKSQALKKEKSFDENLSTGVAASDTTEAAAPTELMQEPIATERPKVEVDVNKAVVAGENKAGKFQVVAGRKRLASTTTTPRAPVTLKPRKTVQEVTPESNTQVAKAAVEEEHLKEARDGALRVSGEGGRAAANDIFDKVQIRRAEGEVDGEFIPLNVSDEEIAAIEDPELRNLIEDIAFRASIEPRSERVDTFADLMPQVFKTVKDNYKGIHQITMMTMANRLANLVPGVKVRSVDDATFLEYTAPEMKRANLNALTDGIYTSANNEIVLAASKLADVKYIAELVLHEGTHAAYLQAMTFNPSIEKEINALMERVRFQFRKENSLLNRLTQKTQKEPYGLTNADEFIAEAFSNPTFQELLTRTPLEEGRPATLGGTIKSVWNALVESIGRALNIRHMTALDKIIKLTEKLDAEAEMFTKYGDDSALRVSTQDVRNVVSDQSMGMTMALKYYGLKAMSLDQIERWARPLVARFTDTNLMGRIQQAFIDTEKFAENKAKESHEHLAQVKLMEAKHPEGMRRAVGILMDAQIYDFDPRAGAKNEHITGNKKTKLQAREVLSRSKAEWASLPSEVRETLENMAEYYKTTFNETRKSVIGAIMNGANKIESYDGPIPSYKYTPELIKNIEGMVMAGKFGDDLRNALDDDVLFENLKNAGWTGVKGMYIPLTRYGDFVVLTKEKLGDTFGAKVTSEGKGETALLEWRGDSEQAAYEQYEKFAKDSAENGGPAVTNVALDRYINGQKVSAEDAKGHPHEVVYRARVQLRGVNMFETGREAAKFIREHKAAGTFAEIDGVPQQRANLDARGALTSQHLSTIMRSLEQNENLSEGERKLLKATLAQASVMAMPGHRIQKHFLARKGIKGASQDISRGLATYAQQDARYHAKVRFLPEMLDHVKEMHRLLGRHGSADKYSQSFGQLTNEIESRINGNTFETRGNAPWVKTLMTINFMDKLFSPAYSVINGTQPWMTTFPVLGGIYGNARTAAAMLNAYNTVGGRKLIQIGIANTARAFTTRAALPRGEKYEKFDLMQSIRNSIKGQPDAAELMKLFDALEEKGFDPNQGMEIAQSVGAGHGKLRGGIAIADRIARQLPQGVEALNRAVTAVAAYRLFVASQPKATLNMADAHQHAFDMINKTQFNYERYNAPPVFSNRFVAPALQFKKYAQGYYGLMAELLRTVNTKDMPKAERIAAGRALLNVVGVQILMAGALSLPGLELLKVGMMVAAFFGLGSGYDDWQRKMRRLFGEHFGKTWGELVSSGILTRSIPAPGGHGVDVSQRLSAADMFIFGEPKTNDDEGAFAFLGRLMLGAPASLVFDWQRGIKKAGDGDWTGALIDMVPNKLVSDIAKGAQKRANEEMTTGEAILQGFGFRSGRVAEKGQEIGSNIAAKKNAEEEIKKLNKKIYSNIGSEERAKLVQERRELYRSMPRKKMDEILAERERERNQLMGR